MNVLTRKLITKDLYMHRWILVVSTASGLVSLALTTSTGALFHVGSLLWISSFVALGVCLALFGIATERKERALQFVLSLPLSHGDYARIKVYAQLVAYLVPWLLLSGGALAIVWLAPHVPDGMAPFVVLLCGYMFANFCIVLCGALLATSEAVIALLIIVTNISVTLFMFVTNSIPGIAAHRMDTVPVWNGAFWTVLACEAAAIFIFCAIPCFVTARRRDFV